MAWRVLVPIKQTSVAKSRLTGATRSEAEHRQLVQAMQLDTLAAVLAVAGAAEQIVAGLAVVGEQVAISLPASIEVLPDAGGGLNPALTAAARLLSERHPHDGVAALVGDLPALRPADLRDGLIQAERHRRSFVRDRAGTGTTLLAVAAGVALDPHFGEGSAQAHLDSGAAELEVAVSLRSDVDSPEDLRQVLALGAGRLTAQLESELA